MWFGYDNNKIKTDIVYITVIGEIMGNLNKVYLIGRLGKDPEPRQTQSGKTVLNITLATSEYYKDQSGNRQERSEWHKIVLWEKKADVVAQYCRKGSQLFLEGSLQTREWQDKEGNKRYTTEILGRNIQFLDAKPQGQAQGTRASQYGGGTDKASNYPGYQTAEAPQGETMTSKVKDEEFPDDDTPF